MGRFAFDFGDLVLLIHHTLEKQTGFKLVTK